MKKNFMGIAMGILSGAIVTEIMIKKGSKHSHEHEEKMDQYYHILNHWLDLRQGNRTLYSYFHDRGYQKVAIYGMKEFGQRLYYELKDTDIKLYLIDKAADKIWFEDDILSPAESIPETDVIVVTAVYYFKDIQKELNKKVKCPIISLQEIVYETK